MIQYLNIILYIIAEDCKKRWRNIRDTYMRNKKKLGTGSAATLAKKKWPLAGRVAFLDHVEYERK